MPGEGSVAGRGEPSVPVRTADSLPSGTLASTVAVVLPIEAQVGADGTVVASLGQLGGQVAATEAPPLPGTPLPMPRPHEPSDPDRRSPWVDVSVAALATGPLVLPAWTPVVPASASEPPSAAPAHAVWAQVEQLAQRMMVAPSPGGGQQMRIEIDPRLLPGVQVNIHFMEGRLQMEFLCSQDASRRRLRSVASREVAGAAGRLGVDVLVSLRSDDTEESDTEFLHASA